MLIYLAGEDAFLAAQAINQLKAKYLAKNPDGAELLDWRSGDGEPNWADLRSVPLFASSRLVIIRAVGLLVVESQKILASYLKDLPASTIVAVWDSKKPVAELASVLAEGKIIKVAPLFGLALERHVADRARALGTILSSEQRRQLLSNTEGDLWYLETELQFLAVAGELGQAQAKKIEEPFIYFNLVSSRNWQKISTQLLVDFRRGQPFELLLGSLAAAVRKELRSEHRLLTELMIDIDFAVKTGLADPETAISLLATRLVQPAAQRVQWYQLWEQVAV